MSGVSCIVFTLNEEVNLPHCLKSLAWCDDIHVVDSFSTDKTETIARSYGVNFVKHSFTGFGDQRNWALTNLKLKHSWVLILDADERTTPALVSEISNAISKNSGEIGAYRMRRKFYLWGQWLRYSSQYPTWVVRLVHKEKTKYLNRGHAETQLVSGSVAALQENLIDENFKDLHSWFSRQNDYSSHEARYEGHLAKFSWSDLLSIEPLKRREAMKAILRRLPARSIFFFCYTYFFRFGFLDGVAGFRFCLMKSIYQEMIALKKHELSREVTSDVTEQKEKLSR